MAYHEDTSFAAALRSVTRLSFFQNNRLTLPRQQRQRSQRERNQLVLAKARMFLAEQVIAAAMQAYGRQADVALKVTDPVRQISLARKNGQEVYASHDPFQRDDLYYLSPDQLRPDPRRQHRPKEPDWSSPPGEAAPTPDYYPPADLTRLVTSLEQETEQGTAPLPLPTDLITDALQRLEQLFPDEVKPEPITRQRISIGEALRLCGFGNVQTSDLTDLRLDRRLLAEGRITETQAAVANALARGLPYLDLDLDPPTALTTLDQATARRERIVLHHEQGGIWQILTDSPQRETMILATLTGYDIIRPQLHIVTTSSFETLLMRVYSPAHLSSTPAQDAAVPAPSVQGG